MLICKFVLFVKYYITKQILYLQLDLPDLPGDPPECITISDSESEKQQSDNEEHDEHSRKRLVQKLVTKTY